MWPFKKKQLASGDATILVAALEKLSKITKPGNIYLEGMDIGKIVHDALSEYKR